MNIKCNGRRSYVVIGICFAFTLVILIFYSYTSELRVIHKTATTPPVQRKIPMLDVDDKRKELDILNPFKHKIDDSVDCLPLPCAMNREPLCSYNPKDDQYISKVLHAKGVWEGDNVQTVKQLLIQNPEFGLLDIGTNLGIYAVTVSSMKRSYVGIECFPPTLNILARTLRLNPHLLPYITIATNAVSDNYDPVEFWGRNSHPGAIETHSETDVKQNGIPYKHERVSKIGSTRAILMDDLLPIIPFKRAIVKMDIEDGESKALAGANKIFEAIDMTHVMMEWAVKWWKRPKDAQFIINFMKDHGYTVHRPKPPFQRMTLSFEASKKWPFDIMWIKNATAKHSG